MKQKNKNIVLVAVWLVLVGTILIIELAEGDGSGTSYDRKMFQLNSQQEITDVHIKGPNLDNHFSYKDGRWRLNDSLFLDQSMRDVFFSVLSQVEVRNPVTQSGVDSINQMIQDKGVKTTIRYGSEVINEYWVSGNKEKEITYMMLDNGTPYQVHLPGYQSYIAGIFEVPTIDWRSRFVFNTNFALLSKIEAEYPGFGEILVLNYKDHFFSIPGMLADSTKIANYLDQLAYLQADRFIPQRLFASSEDTEGEEVFSQIRLYISTGDIETITFYNKPEEERFIKAKINDGSFCEFEFDRIKKVFVRQKDFY